ncbi:hypothetical protein [Pseudomonas serbica]|uniref:hypothetical protein n=1 Tax=Pseudomonas serbica TaxID=2965074 RepID=UPI00237AD96A|nr:hypothetical protein [Pseudomonas serbica]
MFTTLALASSTASAGICEEAKAKLARVYGAIGNHCVNLNREPSLVNNPFVYTNPDAQCDLGLALPGLPGFGIGGGGFNMCSIAKAITGTMVNEVNQGMQTAANAAVSAVDDIAVDTIGVQASGGINVGQAVKANYDKMAPNAPLPGGIVN